MFNRFTDNAKKTMNLARQEAQRLNHEYLGTEHILLGLIRVGDCAGCRILSGLGADPAKLRAEIQTIATPGAVPDISGQLPFTSRAKKVLELAMEQAGFLVDDFIGSEHLLLGLVAEQQGVAAIVLEHAGITLDRARDQLVVNRGESPAHPGNVGTQARALEPAQARYVLELARNVLVQLDEPDAAGAVEGVLRKLEKK